MCVIAVKYKGVDLPQEEHLRACEIRNRDGIGVALLKADATEIMIKKDFTDIDVFIKWFYEIVKKEDTCIIHYRFATHGLKDVGNRHPFPITQNKELLRKPELVCQMAVAHNGVLSEYQHHKKYSDTQKFVLDILSDETIKNNLANPKIRKLINNFLEKDKLVVLQADGTLYYWGEWVKVGEVYYSNASYLDKKVEYVGFGTPYYDNWRIKDKQETYHAFQDMCDGCGQIKKVQMQEFVDSDDSGDYLYLCKSCRKKVQKGKLLLPNQTEKLPGLLTSLKKANDSDDMVQCESCFDWISSKEVCEYYSHKVCTKCLDDVIKSELLPRDKQ